MSAQISVGAHESERAREFIITASARRSLFLRHETKEHARTRAHKRVFYFI